MNRLKLELQPDGLLLLALLYFVGDSGTLLALAAAVAVHEWGHGAALRLCGCRVSRIRVDITGLCMDYSRAVLTAWQEFCCAGAGPAAGIALALMASFWGNWLENAFLLRLAGISWVLSLFNLLPVRPLDGWRMVRAWFPLTAERVGLVCNGLLLIAGLAAAWQGWGCGLLLVSVLLLLPEKVSVPRRKGGFHSRRSCQTIGHSVK